jgi:hypothetical protein
MTDTANWFVHLDKDDREQMIGEVFAGVHGLVKTGSVVRLETCLRDWRTTAQALADPERRAVLAGDLDDEDFTEVQRP